MTVCSKRSDYTRIKGLLFANKIVFDAQAGRDPMTSFRIAAGLAPHAQFVYQRGFNYAGPRWGGSLENLREIYGVAKTNNPGADWPRTTQ